MTCYCKEREINSNFAKTIENIPDGFCGICDICGEPGHMRAHPRQATTGAWCDKHWHELTHYKIITLADIVPFLFYSIIIGIFLLMLWNMTSYF